MEVFKYILINYGPVVCACWIMIYLCFFVMRAINGNEKQLKDSIVNLLRENASLKKELREQQKMLKETMEKINNKVEELNEQIDHIVEGSEDNVGSNEESEA